MYKNTNKLEKLQYQKRLKLHKILTRLELQTT
jgi:hypothetical protein